MAQALINGKWITLHGSPIFIKDGQSLEDAVKARSEYTASRPSGGGEFISATRDAAGVWYDTNGKALKIPTYIPPGWTDVRINTQAGADKVATGLDKKGRRQPLYSQEHSIMAAAKKFDKIEKLEKRSDAIQASLQKATESSDPATAEAAHVALLVASTGLRPGSERDTLADKQAYGATTLEARHVVTTGKSVSLKFVGKKGVDINIPITNEAVAKELRTRAATRKPGEKLFSANNNRVLSLVHDTIGARTKDLRTLMAVKTARALVNENTKRASTMKEFKQRVKAIATTVSAQLGNTPAVALQSYIDPRIFLKIKPLDEA